MSGITTEPSRTAFTGRSAATLLAMLLAGAALGGCMNSGPRFEAPFMLSNPNERHPILVSNSEKRFDIPIRAGAYGLTRSQQSQLNSFLNGYENANGAKLVIQAPAGASYERAARGIFTDVKTILRQRGYTQNMVSLQSYNPGYKSAPAVRLSYTGFVAKGPVCPDWSEDIGKDPHNTPYPNLGCATQANLAAQVANPRDLVQPADQTPRSSERRDEVFKKYIAGESTGAKWDPSLPERVMTSNVGAQ